MGRSCLSRAEENSARRHPPPWRAPSDAALTTRAGPLRDLHQPHSLENKTQTPSPQALEALLAHPDPASARPLGPLSLLSLAAADPAAATALVCRPEATLAALEAGALEAQQVLLEEVTAAASAGDVAAAAWAAAASLKHRVTPRLAPPPPALLGGAERPGGKQAGGNRGSTASASAPPPPPPPLTIGRLRASDAGRLVCLTGTLVGCGPVRALEAVRTFECARCGHLVRRGADLAAQRAPAPPRPAEGCPGPGAGGPGSGGCKGGAWLAAGSVAASVLLGGPAANGHPPELVDYQDARLQDRPGGGGRGGGEEEGGGGSGGGGDPDPAAAGAARAPCVALILTADLAGSAAAGAEATVVGYIVTRWTKPPRDGERCAVELAVVAVGLSVAGAGEGGWCGGAAPAQAAAGGPLALMPAPPAPSPPGADADVAHPPTPLSLLTPASTPGGAAACPFTAFWARHASTPLAARDVALAGIAPGLAGLADAKLAVALALVGGHGPGGDTPASQRQRGDVHVLLAGDPATGKSALLRSAASLAGRRGVAVVARATSAAGLTAAAVKDPATGAWALEPGALALADRGLVAIDGLCALPAADRAALHEAMEQQAVSVAKAGLVGTLPTRCAVVAAAGPLDGGGGGGHGHVRGGGAGRAGGGGAQPPLEAPLLSRFDLVLALRDARLPAWDAGLADHKLGGRRGRGVAGRPPSTATIPPWDAPTLRAFIAWARSRPPPVLSPVAERILLVAYAARRAASAGGGGEDGWDGACSGGGPAHPPTVRALEALARVATAHARLCGGKLAVDAVDAVVAVRLTALGAAALGGGGGGGGGLGPGFPAAGVPPARDPLTSSFLGDPDAAAAADVSAALAAVRAADEQAALERAVAGE